MIWVAEIGSNHKGSKALAYEYIRQASLAGATIAKFQLGWPKRGAKGTASWMRYQPMLWVDDLKKWCDEWDIEFMASIWSVDGLLAARDVGMKRYKIAYKIWREDKELSDIILSDGKETFVSGGTHSTNEKVRPIFCVPQYPTYEMKMPERFIPEARTTSWFGYSSHMHGYADALIAVARGAKYVEKHVTLDKTEESIRDHAFSLSFEEFGEMVRIGNQIARLV